MINQKLISLYQKLCTLFADEYEIELSSEGNIEICLKDEEEGDQKKEDSGMDVFEKNRSLPTKLII